MGNTSSGIRVVSGFQDAGLDLINKQAAERKALEEKQAAERAAMGGGMMPPPPDMPAMATPEMAEQMPSPPPMEMPPPMKEMPPPEMPPMDMPAPPPEMPPMEMPPPPPEMPPAEMPPPPPPTMEGFCSGRFTYWQLALLFFVLSPGVLLTFPPIGRKVFMSGKTSVMAAVVHAIVFVVVLKLIR